ncbi:3-amino-4-hydroxybenzoic acid synthase [compost metagenome]
MYIVNSKGEARVVTVGRLKIESRPLLYIECEVDGTILNTFIQDDWHVRMMGGKGEIRPSSEIKIGDKLLVHLDVPGRHVGLKILETIREV